MSASIHGHEIIRLVHELQPVAADRLVREVERRFGEDASFHACAGGAMTLGELLQFLAARGKISLRSGQYYGHVEAMCEDDHDHDEESASTRESE